MNDPLYYRLVADAVLALHVAFVAFVLGGLVLIVAGNIRGWAWVNSLWFRLGHLAAIAFVVAEAWLGVTCPLTTIEKSFLERAGAITYTGDFIAHWLERILYYRAPPWVFTLIYTAFAGLVVLTWWKYPPRMSRRTNAAPVAGSTP